MAPFFEK